MDEAVDQLRAAYDAVPYESHAFPQTAPGHLAAIAYLFGMDAVDVSTARVLEIGCAAGGNLIPFAAFASSGQGRRHRSVVVQVDQGRRRVQALGLTNLELLQGDVAAMDLAALGVFDFIICHGVYSWVPANVQDAILSAFRHDAGSRGRGLYQLQRVSGLEVKEIVRDAMLLRGGDRATPDEKLSYARGMIDFSRGGRARPAVSWPRPLADYRTIRSQRQGLLHTPRVPGVVQFAVLLPRVRETHRTLPADLSGRRDDPYDVRQELRREDLGAVAPGVWAQPGAGGAVSRFLRRTEPSGKRCSCTANVRRRSPTTLTAAFWPPAFRGVPAACRRRGPADDSPQEYGSAGTDVHGGSRCQGGAGCAQLPAGRGRCLGGSWWIGCTRNLMPPTSRPPQTWRRRSITCWSLLVLGGAARFRLDPAVAGTGRHSAAAGRSN